MKLSVNTEPGSRKKWESSRNEVVNVGGCLQEKRTL